MGFVEHADMAGRNFRYAMASENQRLNMANSITCAEFGSAVLG